MKRVTAGLLLGPLCLGCVTTQPGGQGTPPPTWSWSVRKSSPKEDQPARAEKPPQPAKPVPADQITPANAHQVAEALRNELDQADAEH